eukprot:TRINITY_DN6860_c0_g1_i2.p1 TRINITY_DN6860_c0_g1~~TRINITY_DN6860_c0_g1_i2.p1  ORF type:complete len:154 (-),score=51.72 TRINITY_DN6860_c0_g1_i2:118-579(-)
MKQYPNLLILTTSNITGSIDLAFVDRADIKQFIGLPSQAAVYKIYLTCIQELVRTKILVGGDNILPVEIIKYNERAEESNSKATPPCVSMELWKICGDSAGLSGRTLRKIPFLALAMFCDVSRKVDINSFLKGLRKALEKQRSERNALKSEDS